MAYLDHSTLEQAEESKALARTALTDATGECALQIQAHRWVSLARSADFGLNPRRKIEPTQDRIGPTRQALVERPEDDVKALRLSITGTAPRFLSASISTGGTDLAALRRLLAMDHWAESPKFSAWMSNLAEQIEQERS